MVTMDVPVENQARWHRERHDDDRACLIGVSGAELITHDRVWHAGLASCAVLIGYLSVPQHSLAAYALGRPAPGS
jgi:hypothetical protein